MEAGQRLDSEAPERKILHQVLDLGPQQRRWRRVEETLDVKTASEARAILNERLGDVSKGLTPVAVSKVRLSELYEDLIADYRNKNQRLENLERPWNHIEAFFGPDCLAKTITDSRMQHYIDSRREAGAAPATILNEISMLRRMLRLGYEHRKLAQLPRFPTIRAENARQIYFTKGELDGLVKALPEEIAEGGRGDLGNEWLVPFVITAFWTGARLRELLHLERRRLDLEAGKITLPPGSTKNRKAGPSTSRCQPSRPSGNGTERAELSSESGASSSAWSSIDTASRLVMSSPTVSSTRLVLEPGLLAGERFTTSGEAPRELPRERRERGRRHGDLQVEDAGDVRSIRHQERGRPT
jgi:integrase